MVLNELIMKHENETDRPRYFNVRCSMVDRRRLRKIDRNIRPGQNEQV